MTENQQTHVKITIEDLYREQQEMKQLLTRMSQQLDAFGDLPTRVTKLEINQARDAWVTKVVWAALASGVAGFLASIWQVVSK
jgi:hypothetical protein